ncbi:MAG: nucleotidyltransferase family protein [Thermodesulfobacteriota bacterium]
MEQKTPISPENNNLQSQIKTLETILLKNPVLNTIFERVPDLQLPNWYVGAGCLCQTVWNFLSGRDLLSNINDVDLVYFDAADLTDETETYFSDTARKLFSDIPIRIDIKNQARVHLWYESHFGYSIQPYQSVEEAINTWPTTATAVAVRYDDRRLFSVYAPYGLDDLFGLIVRPNKVQIIEEIYLAKVNRWKACWPALRIIPW